jgi:hypothetical protein
MHDNYAPHPDRPSVPNLISKADTIAKLIDWLLIVKGL